MSKTRLISLNIRKNICLAFSVKNVFYTIYFWNENGIKHKLVYNILSGKIKFEYSELADT